MGLNDKMRIHIADPNYLGLRHSCCCNSSNNCILKQQKGSAGFSVQVSKKYRPIQILEGLYEIKLTFGAIDSQIFLGNQIWMKFRLKFQNVFDHNFWRHISLLLCVEKHET